MNNHFINANAVFEGLEYKEPPFLTISTIYIYIYIYIYYELHLQDKYKNVKNDY